MKLKEMIDQIETKQDIEIKEVHTDVKIDIETGEVMQDIPVIKECPF